MSPCSSGAKCDILPRCWLILVVTRCTWRLRLTGAGPAPERVSMTKPEFTKLSRVKLWAGRPHQINSKIVRAYLELEKGYGRVTLSHLRKYCAEKFGIKTTFDGHFASMKTDKGNSHGAVFYESGQVVKIWDMVYTEIQIHFLQDKRLND